MWMILTPVLVVAVCVLAALSVPPEGYADLETLAMQEIAEAMGGSTALQWRAESNGGWLDSMLPDVPLRGRWIAWAALVTLRARFVAVWIPPLMFLAAAVGAMAFAGRARIASADRVPSPALAFLAKRGVVLSAGGALLFTGLPIACPGWTFPAAAVCAIACLRVYISNLPDRL